MKRRLAALVLSVIALAPRAALAEPTAAPPVVFFGDSLTQGLHASHPDLAYRELLARRLATTRDAGRSVAVIQHPQGLLDDAEFRLPQVLAVRPRLVFVELGHHELWADERELDLFEPRYAAILDRLLGSGADVIPATLAWLGQPVDTPQYRAALRINGVVRRLAEERSLVVADLWTLTDRRTDLISTPFEASFMAPYLGDYLHPNDAGHRVLAEAFWNAYRALRGRPQASLVRPL